MFLLHFSYVIWVLNFKMQNTKTFSLCTSFFNNYCAEDMAANCRDKHISGF